MRSFILGLMFCFMASFAYAGVTAEVISKDIDVNGNIRIWTCHKIDGVEVESNYPKIDGHFVYCTRYSKQNFKECADKEAIENYILDDIKNHSESLLQKEFNKKAPKTFNQIVVDYKTIANDAFMKTNLDKLISKSVSIVEIKKQLDTDNDGVLDKELTLKQDGSKVEEDITP